MVLHRGLPKQVCSCGFKRECQKSLGKKTKQNKTTRNTAPQNLMSVNRNENHTFTISRLGWKKTLATEPQDKKERPPYLTPPAESLTADVGFALCSLHWKAGMLLCLSGEKGYGMKALLITVACSSLPSQHYALKQRKREAGPVLCSL